MGIFPHGKDLEGAEVVEGLNGKFLECAAGLADTGAVAFDGSLGERTRISRCSGLASIKLTLASFKGEYVLAVEEIVQLVGGTG